MTNNFENILNDLNPKHCLTPFSNSSIKHAFLISGIFYGIAIIISILLQKVDLPYINFYKEALVELPQTMFNSTIITPLFEEIFFFGSIVNITSNPFIILVWGIFWSISHLFAPFNETTSSLSLDVFLVTIPVLIIHFKLWKNKLGWISIVMHCVYNTFIQYNQCLPYISPCPQFYENNFEFPEFYIYSGITIGLTIMTYFLYRRKEEMDYIKKRIEKNSN